MTLVVLMSLNLAAAIELPFVPADGSETNSPTPYEELQPYEEQEVSNPTPAVTEKITPTTPMPTDAIQTYEDQEVTNLTPVLTITAETTPIEPGLTFVPTEMDDDNVVASVTPAIGDDSRISKTPANDNGTGSVKEDRSEGSEQQTQNISEPASSSNVTDGEKPKTENSGDGAPDNKSNTESNKASNDNYEEVSSAKNGDTPETGLVNKDSTVNDSSDSKNTLVLPIVLCAVIVCGLITGFILKGKKNTKEKGR